MSRANAHTSPPTPLRNSCGEARMSTRSRQATRDAWRMRCEGGGRRGRSLLCWSVKVQTPSRHAFFTQTLEEETEMPMSVFFMMSLENGFHTDTFWRFNASHLECSKYCEQKEDQIGTQFSYVDRHSAFDIFLILNKEKVWGKTRGMDF